MRTMETMCYSEPAKANFKFSCCGSVNKLKAVHDGERGTRLITEKPAIYWQHKVDKRQRSGTDTIKFHILP